MASDGWQVAGGKRRVASGENEMAEIVVNLDKVTVSLAGKVIFAEAGLGTAKGAAGGVGRSEWGG
ncbi:MAG: hypothetical protein M5U34_30235 [Chloroflexi bacterium]|nr:hypothetical protein [Chloroflexota bacterium]